MSYGLSAGRQSNSKYGRGIGIGIGTGLINSIHITKKMAERPNIGLGNTLFQSSQ